MAEMVETKDLSAEPGQPNLFWWVTLGYAVLAGLGWLMVGMSRLVQWRGVMSRVTAATARGELEVAQRGEAFAGGVAVDMAFALGTMLVFAFVAITVSHRTWNAWDYATVAIGAMTVLSSVLICARGNMLLFIPITAAPLWGLLYVPGTKLACNVRKVAEPPIPTDLPLAALGREEIEREIAKERHLIMQLSQNLDVFEVERAMDTDVFVRRYTDGIEEENADNAEWFSIARAVRNSRRRLEDLKAQLDSVSDTRP